METTKNNKNQSHGLRKHPLYYTWNTILKRTMNPKSADYKFYGARGIGMYPEWIDAPTKFIEYVETYVGPKRPGYQLDLIDNDRDYEPGNLRWLTVKENSRNKSNCIRFEWEGKTVTLTEFLENNYCPVSYAGVKTRIARGWSPLQAVTTPMRTTRRSRKDSLADTLDY